MAPCKTYRSVKLLLVSLCAAGMALSGYAFHVEKSKEESVSYRALCDFSDSVSCSKVFTSRYGRGFGLIDRIFSKTSVLNQPNSIFGMAFYTMEMILTFINLDYAVGMQTLAAVIANFGSVYLFCVLYFILHDFCIVCISMYVVNALILVCSFYRLMILSKTEAKKKA